MWWGEAQEGWGLGAKCQRLTRVLPRSTLPPPSQWTPAMGGSSTPITILLNTNITLKSGAWYWSRGLTGAHRVRIVRLRHQGAVRRLCHARQPVWGYEVSAACTQFLYMVSGGGHGEALSARVAQRFDCGADCRGTIL